MTSVIRFPTNRSSRLPPAHQHTKICGAQVGRYCLLSFGTRFGCCSAWGGGRTPALHFPHPRPWVPIRYWGMGRCRDQRNGETCLSCGSRASRIRVMEMFFRHDYSSGGGDFSRREIVSGVSDKTSSWYLTRHPIVAVTDCSSSSRFPSATKALVQSRVSEIPGSL